MLTSRPMRKLTLKPFEARRLLRELLETASTEAGVDELASPEQVHAWLTGRGLLEEDVEVTPADVQLMAQLREGLREMNAADTDNQASQETIATLDWIAARAPLRARFGRRGNAWLEPAVDGFDGAVGRLLIIYHISRLKGSGSVRKRRPSVEDRWLTR